MIIEVTECVLNLIPPSSPEITQAHCPRNVGAPHAGAAPKRAATDAGVKSPDDEPAVKKSKYFDIKEGKVKATTPAKAARGGAGAKGEPPKRTPKKTTPKPGGSQVTNGPEPCMYERRAGPLLHD